MPADRGLEKLGKAKMSRHELGIFPFKVIRKMMILLVQYIKARKGKKCQVRNSPVSSMPLSLWQENSDWDHCWNHILCHAWLPIHSTESQTKHGCSLSSLELQGPKGSRLNIFGQNINTNFTHTQHPYNALRWSQTRSKNFWSIKLHANKYLNQCFLSI